MKPHSEKTEKNRVLSAVKGVIFNRKDKFLVIRQVINGLEFWDLPGGKMHYGEVPHETLKREVLEETNLKVNIEKIAGVWWFRRLKDGDDVVCLTYICSVVSGKLGNESNPSKDEVNETKEFKWISKEEFLSGNYNCNRANSSLRDLISSL